jgi:hypothetical protein
MLTYRVSIAWQVQPFHLAIQRGVATSGKEGGKAIAYASAGHADSTDREGEAGTVMYNETVHLLLGTLIVSRARPSLALLPTKTICLNMDLTAIAQGPRWQETPRAGPSTSCSSGKM